MRKRKIVIGVLLVLSMCFYCANVGQTQTTIPVSVTFPPGAFTAKISKIIANSPFDGTTDTWPAASAPSETSMSFGSLVELTDPATGAKLGVFGPSDRRYYAIDMAISGGGAPTSISVSIAWVGADAAVLGPHISATYKTMTWVSATSNPTEVPVIAGPQPISTSVGPFGMAAFTGHWIRLYAGVFVPVAGAPAVDPTGLVPFTAASAAKSYNASLQITVI
jgi:hypothetical protein